MQRSKSVDDKRYVKEAIALIDAGKQIKPVRRKRTETPQELQKALRRRKGATAAYSALRPGQQREYAEYTATARRDDTKQRRLEKILPMIISGNGLNDRYR